MRINAQRLKTMAVKNGVSAEQLAGALPRSPRRKQAELALSKVRNWLAGRDHPRCTPAEMEAMAGVLGCRPKDLARFTSRYRFARSSARKASLLTQLIMGRRVDEASALLEFNPKRAAVMVKKTLDAAIADAEAAEAAVDRLFVAESRVDSAMSIKRFQPKDRGRAHPILKRTSHIVVGVEEAR